MDEAFEKLLIKILTNTFIKRILKRTKLIHCDDVSTEFGERQVNGKKKINELRKMAMTTIRSNGIAAPNDENSITQYNNYRNRFHFAIPRLIEWMFVVTVFVRLEA